MKGQLAYKDIHGVVWGIALERPDEALAYAAYATDGRRIPGYSLNDVIEFVDKAGEDKTTPSEPIQLEAADKSAHPDLRDNS